VLAVFVEAGGNDGDDAQDRGGERSPQQAARGFLGDGTAALVIDPVKLIQKRSLSQTGKGKINAL